MKYMTVVYEIKDSEAFQPVLDSLKDRFIDEERKDYQVVAMGIGNEIDRLQLIEMAIEQIEDRYDIEDCIVEMLALGGDDFYQKGVELIKEYLGD